MADVTKQDTLQAVPCKILVQYSGRDKLDGTYERCEFKSCDRPVYRKTGGKNPMYMYWRRNWKLGLELGSRRSFASLADEPGREHPCEPYPHRWQIFDKVAKKHEENARMKVVDCSRLIGLLPAATKQQPLADAKAEPSKLGKRGRAGLNDVSPEKVARKIPGRGAKTAGGDIEPLKKEASNLEQRISKERWGAKVKKNESKPNKKVGTKRLRRAQDATSSSSNSDSSSDTSSSEASTPKSPGTKKANLPRGPFKAAVAAQRTAKISDNQIDTFRAQVHKRLELVQDPEKHQQMVTLIKDTIKKKAKCSPAATKLVQILEHDFPSESKTDDLLVERARTCLVALQDPGERQKKMELIKEHIQKNVSCSAKAWKITKTLEEEFPANLCPCPSQRPWYSGPPSPDAAREAVIA